MSYSARQRRGGPGSMRQTYAKRLAVALDRLRTLLPEAGPDQ